MKPFVIGVAGGIGVGKTTFAQSLAERLGATIVSFGDYVRSVSAERQIPPTREALQELGAALKEHLGDDEFVSRVLHHGPATATVIVEGVRHVEVATALLRAAEPRPFALIYLDASLEARQERIAASRPSEAARLTAAVEHSTELQVQDGTLAAKADLVLPTSDVTVHELVDRAASWLAEHFK